MWEKNIHWKHEKPYQTQEQKHWWIMCVGVFEIGNKKVLHNVFQF